MENSITLVAIAIVMVATIVLQWRSPARTRYLVHVGATIATSIAVVSWAVKG